jgi:hypothetical protein
LEAFADLSKTFWTMQEMYSSRRRLLLDFLLLLVRVLSYRAVFLGIYLRRTFI